MVILSKNNTMGFLIFMLLLAVFFPSIFWSLVVLCIVAIIIAVATNIDKKL